jgi:hypothetical protein
MRTLQVAWGRERLRASIAGTNGVPRSEFESRIAAATAALTGPESITAALAVWKE